VSRAENESVAGVVAALVAVCTHVGRVQQAHHGYVTNCALSPVAPVYAVRGVSG
jgi:hypothetical protein